MHAVFEGVLVKKAKRSCAESNEEQKVSAAALVKRWGLPMTFDIVWSLRYVCWDKTDWTCKGKDQKMMWLGVAIGFDSGPRVGNDAEEEAVRGECSSSAGSLHEGGAYVSRGIGGRCLGVDGVRGGLSGVCEEASRHAAVCGLLYQQVSVCKDRGFEC